MPEPTLACNRPSLEGRFLYVTAGATGTARAGEVGALDLGASAELIDVAGSRTYVCGYGDASFTRIGGTAPGEGNLASGNSSGIEVGGPGQAGNLVLENLVGVDVSGTQPLPNQGPGVTLDADGRTIVGGATAAERNVISLNGDPVYWSGGVAITRSHNTVMGNYIGTDAEGDLTLDKPDGLTGPYVTATATDGEGNTSQFSAPVAPDSNAVLCP